jgi:peptide/nickel transport system substrate-binding protein
MKHFVWRCLAVSSLLGLTLMAGAETRPQYGGTLRVAMRATPTSLDPADRSQVDSFSRRSLTLLMFETLVTSGESGRIQPCLAVSWQAAPGNQRWQFQLRRGVKFHDGTPLTPEIAAASLRTANPSWNVFAEGDSVVVEREAADPGLLAELALPRNAIAKRNGDNKPGGTGPFQIADWQPGKKLTMSAEENYWHGRAFLDGIEITMGMSYHDQLMALEVGRADLVEVATEQVHRVSLEGRQLKSSSPMELLALVFTRDVVSPEDKVLREALALSVERGSIRSVLLQGAGQPTGGILPSWMTGYGFVFPTEADLTRARHEREQVRNIPAWTLGYDGSDAVLRLIAERVALNARDAGLTLQPNTGLTTTVRLVRMPLSSVDARLALSDVATAAGLPATKIKNSSAEELYASEQGVLATQRMIPLFHLPVSYAAGTSLRNWTLRADGNWSLADAWLGNSKP